MSKEYPLHPGQTHASPLYTQLPLEEYEAIMKENKALKQANANMAESIAELDAMRQKEVELDMRERVLDERERKLNEPEFFDLIYSELKTAKEKHPKFCEDFTDDLTGMKWQEYEDNIKARNEDHAPTAESILMEEIAEAFNAYQHGDLENSMAEFAQCGAVIMRMMEFIQNKMDEELKNTLVLDIAYHDFNSIYHKAKNKIKFPVENREIARLLVDEASLAKEFWSCKDEKSNITCGQLVKKHIKKYDKVLFKCGSKKIEFKNPKITTWLDYRDRNFFVITWEEM